MFRLDRPLWNDGPPLLDFMGSEGAPPVARQHLCYGGGGGDTVAPPPDYSGYISAMTEIGNQGTTWARELFGWAKQQGVDLTNLAKSVSDRALGAAGLQQGRADSTMDQWRDNYGDLYEGQANVARAGILDLPAAREQSAGKFGADTAQAIDQAKQVEMRNLRAQGFSPSAIAGQAIDTAAGTQRAAAITAASEVGRDVAENKAWGRAKEAIDTGSFLPGVAATEAGLATANRNQGVNAPLAAASTTAGLYAPAQGFYSAAFPYMKQWGDAQAKAYDQKLAAAKINEEGGDDTAGMILGTVGTIGGAVAGGYFGGPMGASAGASAGGAAGKSIGKAISAEGGRIPGRRYAGGGAIDTSAPEGNLVPEEASPSGGSQVDDVSAMVTAGEFVIPKRTVDWLGDKFFQKLIMKTDDEMQQNTVAAPEEGPPPTAVDVQAPMFRSEGARV